MTAAARHGHRRRYRRVTVLRCDLAGAGRAAGEPGRRAGRAESPEWFLDEARDLLKEHGGVIATIPGARKEATAITAVFGLDQSEDHAIRALSAGLKLKRMSAAQLAVRRRGGPPVHLLVGADTGEVFVAGEPGTNPIVEGEPVDHAGRLVSLRQNTGQGEILFGPSTHQEVREYVEAEPLQARATDQRGDQLNAWRLHTFVRNVQTPRGMVGRNRELHELDLLYRNVADGHGSCLVNVVGESGIGKSRLVLEFARKARRRRARVLNGSCAPYGKDVENIAYWPIAEMLRQASAIRPGDTSARARGKLMDLITDSGIVTQIAGLLSLPAGDLNGDGRGRQSTGETDDMFRAVSEVLRRLAERSPLVLVFDDLQWAHEALLEFVGQLGRALARSRVMFLCLARSDAEQASVRLGQWVPNDHPLRLGRLNDADTNHLVDALLRKGPVPDEARARLLEAMESFKGHPLFIEALLVTLEEEGTLRLVNGEWVVDDAIRAQAASKLDELLKNRLLQLAGPADAVLQRASVIGPMYFTAEELAALAPGKEPTPAEDLSGALRELIDKQLLEPLESDDGPRAFRFRHLMVREAAYLLVDERDRAELHERYASWRVRAAERPVGPHGEHVIGYHFDKAQQLWRRHRATARTAALSIEAGRHLAAAGKGYLRQGDFAAAVAVLDRAVALLADAPDLRLRARLRLADALREHEPRQTERPFVRALRAYQASVQDARSLGDRRVEQHALLGCLEIRLFKGSMPYDTAVTGTQNAIDVFEAAGDRVGLAKAWNLSAWIRAATGQSEQAASAVRKALAHVSDTADDRLQSRMRRNQLVILFWGPTHVDQVASQSEEALAWATDKGMFSLQSAAHNILARVAAMRCDFEEARRRNQRARRLFDPDDVQDPAELLAVSADAISEGFVELYAGNLEGAERVLRHHHATQGRRGGAGALADLDALLARVLIHRQRLEEAWELTRQCRRNSPGRSHDTQIKWRELQARTLAQRGRLGPAERLASEALTLALHSQHFDSRGEALLTLAEIKLRRDRYEDAESLAREALQGYREKGDQRSVLRVQRFLERVGESAIAPARRPLLWLAGSKPPLRPGRAATVAFRLVEHDWGHPSSALDPGPARELFVVLSANAARVRPLGGADGEHEGGHRVLLPARGGTDAVRFQVVPAVPGTMRLWLRVYLAPEGTLLQELAAELTVADDAVVADTNAFPAVAPKVAR